MAKISVLPLDIFVVINKSLLNDQNRLYLSLLYQPIVGSIAIGLYVTLWSYLNGDTSLENIHQDLITNMQMKLEDIVEAREKLEALGLIKTYYKKGEVNSYIYELYNPLNAYEFLNNPILNTALKNNVSSKEYKRIIDKFIVPKIELKQYEDISCNFKDIFNFIDGSINNQVNIKKAKQLGLAFEPTINFNELLSLIPEEYLNYKSVTKDVKNMIYQLAFIYDLNNEKMRDIMENSIEDRQINLDLLKNNCRNYYKFEHMGRVPTIIYNNQPLSLRVSNFDNTKKAKLIRQFETTSPYEFLSCKQGNSTPTTNDLKIIEYLIIDQKLTPGVTNVLIDYVLKINNNKLIKSFVAQIAAQWKRSNIQTVSDAMDMAQKEYDNRGHKPKKSDQKVPLWLGQKIDDELLSEKDLQILKQKVKGDLDVKS